MVLILLWGWLCLYVPRFPLSWTAWVPSRLVGSTWQSKGGGGCFGMHFVGTGRYQLVKHQLFRRCWPHIDEKNWEIENLPPIADRIELHVRIAWEHVVCPNLFSSLEPVPTCTEVCIDDPPSVCITRSRLTMQHRYTNHFPKAARSRIRIWFQFLAGCCALQHSYDTICARLKNIWNTFC